MQIDGNEAAEAVFDQVFSREQQPEAQAEPTGQPRDDSGRFAARDQQSVEPKAEATPAPEAQPQALAEPQPQEQRETAPRMIPLPELQSERQKRQEAERRVAEYEGQLKAFEAMFRQQQPQQPRQEVQAPDPYADPEGYAAFREQRMHVQFRDQIANMSEAMARRQLGDEVVQKATQWALQTGQATQFYMHARDPYGELIDAYKRQEALTRIGSDPDAYEKKLEEQIRAKVLAELKAGTASGQPKPQFPGTLAGATATGKQGNMLSPQAAADAVFARPGGG